jgi:hypothetical protein
LEVPQLAINKNGNQGLHVFDDLGGPVASLFKHVLLNFGQVSAEGLKLLLNHLCNNLLNHLLQGLALPVVKIKGLFKVIGALVGICACRIFDGLFFVIELLEDDISCCYRRHRYLS